MQSEGALKVLRGVHALLLRGWCQHAMQVNGRFSLYGAIAEVGQGNIEGEYARRVLRRFIGLNIPAWNDDPTRTKEEVLHVVSRAIEEAGGRKPRRGGWSVSSANQGWWPEVDRSAR